MTKVLLKKKRKRDITLCAPKHHNIMKQSRREGWKVQFLQILPSSPRRPPPYHTNLERSSIEHSIVFVYIITTIHKLREGFFVQASSSSALLFCASYVAVVVVFKCLVKIFGLSKKMRLTPRKKRVCSRMPNPGNGPVWSRPWRHCMVIWAVIETLGI